MCRPRSSRLDLPQGGVAVSLQSGSIGASVLRLASELSIGLSWFVSLGDKADVSGNDLLQFWEDDEATRVIAMYTESFGNPRKFARIARRVSDGSGRSSPCAPVPRRAAATGAALYAQAGLIEVPTVRAMLDTVRVLATQPVPRGSNVAILTNARSPGVLARRRAHHRRARRGRSARAPRLAIRRGRAGSGAPRRARRRADRRRARRPRPAPRHSRRSRSTRSSAPPTAPRSPSSR